MGRRSSTLCTFSKASRTSNSPFGLLALEKEMIKYGVIMVERVTILKIHLALT